MNLSAAVEQWITQRDSEGYSPYTIKAYRLQMRLLIRELGDLQVSDVRLEDLRRYIAAHSGRLKPSSVSNRVRMIKSFFTWAMEEDVVPKSPAHKLKEPKLPERIPKAFNMEELEGVREGCRTPREHALVELLFTSGCRSAEVSSINREDIDWHRRCIVVMGKGSKERTVFIGARASIRLRRYLESRKDNHPALFVTEKGPVGRLLPRQVWWVVKKVGARAGMRAKTWPHRLRHSFATMMLNAGARLDDVQGLLGHSRPETTQLYAVRSGANLQRAHQQHFIQ
jgi:integrase/recombinase XerD